MRNISQLLADKVCCYILLIPIRKVKGTTLTARGILAARGSPTNTTCFDTPDFEKPFTLAS